MFGGFKERDEICYIVWTNTFFAIRFKSNPINLTDAIRINRRCNKDAFRIVSVFFLKFNKVTLYRPNLHYCLCAPLCHCNFDQDALR